MKGLLLSLVLIELPQAVSVLARFIGQRGPTAGKLSQVEPHLLPTLDLRSHPKF